jgi:hypothetical protein
MSDLRDALEAALTAMTPPLATAWEAVAYTPIVGTPYQRVALVPGAPINDEYGRGFQDQGFFQVSLHYPPGLGSKDATDRALALRSTFYRGATFTKNGLVVKIMRTPAILPAMDDDQGRYVLPVSIQYLTSIQS